ncbi:hypothetical protein [Brasilonema sennae]|uniref:hypothetical protein n=1 Tax=Brasilonema sennae TaxID=1397703 RepID=UPI001552A5EE|nr:hypothetical protein [Brasilonema sennae]
MRKAHALRRSRSVSGGDTPVAYRGKPLRVRQMPGCRETLPQHWSHLLQRWSHQIPLSGNPPMAQSATLREQYWLPYTPTSTLHDY